MNQETLDCRLVSDLSLHVLECAVGLMIGTELVSLKSNVPENRLTNTTPAVTGNILLSGGIRRIILFIGYSDLSAFITGESR